MTKRILAQAAATLCILMTASTSHSSRLQSSRIRPPNIVIVFLDDAGYGDFGCFGSRTIRTPNIDRLARGGRKFTNFHVAQPVCSASRTALLTGCYPSRLGIMGALGPKSKIGIHDREVTIASMLKPLGYATGIFGKWHLGDSPEFLPSRHGFDEYLGLPYSNDMWPLHPTANRGSYPPLQLLDGEKPVIANVTAEDQSHLTEKYTARAVSFIERNREKPFFLYVPHSMPHVPLYPGEKFRGRSKYGIYADVIEELDDSIGRIVSVLRRNHLERNTLVIVTSDNGPWLSYGDHAGSAGPLREGKGTCWEGGVREPCVMSWPGRIPAGTTCDVGLMTIDLLPTIAGLTGAKLPDHPIDGLDVWPIISGKRGAKNPHSAYYYYYENNQLQAVTSGDGQWKLILPHTYRTMDGKPGGKDGKPNGYTQKVVSEPELYDLKEDIGETTNVAGSHGEIVKRLLECAESARAELGDSLTKRVGRGVREPGRIKTGSASLTLSQ